MAVARAQGQGGISGISIWLFVFVGLWLVSTVLLVMLYTQQEKKDQAVDEITALYAKVVSSASRSLPQFTEGRAGEGLTMSDLLEKARSETANLAVGDPAASLDKVRSALDAQLEKITADERIDDKSLFAGVSYDGALRAMHELFRTEADARAEARQGLDDLTAEMDSLRDSYAQIQADFDKQAEELKGKVNEIEAARGQYGDERDTQIDDFRNQLEQIKQQCSDDIQNQRSIIAQLRKDYSETLAQLQDLKEKLGRSQVSPVDLATARTGDGVIMDARPGSRVVYINLGANDNITLGLEFAVYDALSGVPEDGRAKARIEVVSVFETTSECRVTQLARNAMIASGDIIANPIYDKDRTLRFFILGEFDLDGDQRIDPDGRERIAALIEAWGGSVETEISGLLDFVVLGGPPERPRPSSDREPDDDPRFQAAQRAYDAYQSQVAMVQGLAIPKLTQSVFLNFLGYSGTKPASVAGGF